MINRRTLRARACATCGRLPRYYGRRELLKLVHAWEGCLRGAASSGELLAAATGVQSEMRAVLDDVEGACAHPL
jgi:hypothetical protein